MITLDGSYGEGGGALVRTALALSTLTQQPCTITNIRAGRDQPGLKSQHLTIINALKVMSGAQTNDITLGSTNLEFTPGKIKKGIYQFDIGTAGSISLFLQGVLPCCLFAPGKITLKIKGGTGGKWQSPVDFTQHILFPYLERFAEKIDCKILQRGYYPIGGGLVEVSITPKYAPADILDFLSTPLISPFVATHRGPLEQIRGIINISAQLAEKQIAERIEKTARLSLAQHDVPISLRCEYAQTPSIGGEIILWALCQHPGSTTPCILSYNELIEKEKTAEQVATKAVQGLNSELNSTNAVDQFLIDQLVVYMAFLPGSRIAYAPITEHAKTNIHVIEQFLPVTFVHEKGILETQPRR